MPGSLAQRDLKMKILSIHCLRMMHWRKEYGARLSATSIPALALTGLVTFASVHEWCHKFKKPSLKIRAGRKSKQVCLGTKRNSPAKHFKNMK